jgi:hypothetical protein
MQAHVNSEEMAEVTTVFLMARAVPQTNCKADLTRSY